jgi:hypothetical protein
MSNGGQLWLDGLYFRHQPATPMEDPFQDLYYMIYVGTSEKLWMTDVTFQDDGDGKPNARSGIDVGSDLYAEGALP